MGWRCEATLPETRERLQQELDLQVLLGVAWSHISGWATPAIRQVYARARELGQRLGASQQLLAVLLGQFVGYLQQAELQTAQELAMHLLTQVQGQSDPIPLLAAHATLGMVLLARGEVVAGASTLTQSMTLYVPTAHRTLIRHYGSDLGVIVRGNVAMSLWLLGAPQQALEHIHALHALAQELSHPPVSGLPPYYRTCRAMAAGRASHPPVDRCPDGMRRGVWLCTTCKLGPSCCMVGH